MAGEFTAKQYQFGDFTLDQGSYRLRRGEQTVRLEKIPMELLILLVERGGALVTRDDIAGSLWGEGVFVDVEHGINTAIRKVRRALRDDPDQPRYVETVVGRGYRFAAAVTWTDAAASTSASAAAATPAGIAPERTPAAAPPSSPSPSALASAAPPQAGSFASRWRQVRVLVGIAAVLALTTGAILLNRVATAPHSAVAAPIRSIAVLPLKNLSGDPSQEYFADGMTESLIGGLSRIHDIRVISRTSVMRFKETKLSVPEIARILGVDAVVEGSVMRDGNRVRVHAQLIRAATDGHIWSETYDRQLPDVLELEGEVAQAVAAKVEVTVTGKERERLAAVRAVSPDVYEAYLKGRFATENGNSRSEIEKGIAYLQTAIRIDPTFAPAYVVLAKAYADLSTVFIGVPAEDLRPKIVAAARKALELDPELAEAYVVLADTDQKQWRWAEAEAEYHRALELNPSDAAAHVGLATWLACQGRTREAVDSVERGRQLDPVSISGTNVAWMLFFARRYDDAIRELRSASALRPDDANTLWLLGFVLLTDGKAEQAIAPLERAVAASDRSPGVLAIMAAAYAQAGRRADALRLVDEMQKRRRTGYMPAGAFVNAYLGLRDTDQTFAWMERAYGEHSNLLQFLKVHPAFDPVRDDPRFASLVRRVGLQ